MEEVSLLTLYYGADTREAEARELASELRRRHPQRDVEVVYGGQPHYYYIVSAE
jgi:hypothetical protein